MTTTARPPAEQNIFMTREEGWDLLDQHARRYLGMSAEEFIQAWKEERFPDPDRPEIMRVAVLLPLAR